MEKRRHKERGMKERRKEEIKGGRKEKIDREKKDQMNSRKKNGKHVGFEILMVMTMKLVDTNISEEPAASILKVGE
jgi:hypothetical protein